MKEERDSDSITRASIIVFVVIGFISVVSLSILKLNGIIEMSWLLIITSHIWLPILLFGFLIMFVFSFFAFGLSMVSVTMNIERKNRNKPL